MDVYGHIHWDYIYIYIHIYPIGSMYGIYANIGGILMVNVTIYSIHVSCVYIVIYIYIYIWLYPKLWGLLP